MSRLALVVFGLLLINCSDDTRPLGDAGPDTGVADTGRIDTGMTGDVGDVDTGSQDTGIGDTGADPGECQTDADCGGRRCLRIPDQPGGYRTCETLSPMEAVMCQGAGVDECCSSGECTAGSGGGCFLGPHFLCSGIMPTPTNVCLYDECDSDDDCTPPNGIGFCLPRNAFGEWRRVCSFGECLSNAQCGARVGGECLPFFDPCTRRATGFFCSYADSECRRDADCSDAGGYCSPGTDGDTSCEIFVPPP